MGESVEDIRVSYNSTAANRTSNLNLLAGVTVNVSDDCIVIEKSPCQIPNSVYTSVELQTLIS